jgi:hypothetical protein
VTVLPITSRNPGSPAAAIAIPSELKERIGLDRSRDAFVVLDEANIFTWPGFDVIPKVGGGFVRGMVSSGFFRSVREAVYALRAQRRTVDRD